MVSLARRAYDRVVSAPSLAGRPTLRIRGVSYPVLLPSIRDPRLHIASVIFTLHVLGPGRVQLPALDPADPRVDPHLRAARGRHHVLEAARDPVARERDAHGQRHRLYPARAGHRARRLVEPPRHLDLHRRGGGLAALQVPDPLPRPAHLQSRRTSGSCSASCCSGSTRTEPLEFWWGPTSPWLVSRSRSSCRRARRPHAAATCSASPCCSG